MQLPQCYAIRRGCSPDSPSVPIHRHPAPAATFVGALPTSRWVLCDVVDADPNEKWFQLRGCGGYVRRDHLPCHIVDTSSPCDQAALELSAADTVLLAVAHGSGPLSNGISSGPAVLLGLQQLARYFALCRRPLEPRARLETTRHRRRRQIPALPVQDSIPTLAAAVFTPGSDGSASATDKIVGIGGCSQVRIGALRQNTAEGRDMHRRMSSASDPGTPVAVKVVDVRQAGGFERVAFEAAVGEAVADAQASSRLCPSYGVFDAASGSTTRHARHGTTCAIVSPLVDGVPLTEVMAQHGAFTEHEALWILREVLLALHELHTRIGVVHGDVKPENVLLTKGGQPVLIDYGCATPLTPAGDGAAPAGLDGALGTAGFVAPELLRAAAPDDGQCDRSPKIDVYGCGAMLQDLLSGGDSRLRGSRWYDGIVTNAAGADAVDVRGLFLPARPAASPTTVALINVLIAGDPAERPEVADVLRAPIFGPPMLATWVDWKTWFAACVRDCALLVRLKSDAETVTRLSESAASAAANKPKPAFQAPSDASVVASTLLEPLSSESAASDVAAAATTVLLRTSDTQVPLTDSRATEAPPLRRVRKAASSKSTSAPMRPPADIAPRAAARLTRSATATGSRAPKAAANNAARGSIGAAVQPIQSASNVRSTSVSARPSANESARSFLDRLATPKKPTAADRTDANANSLTRPNVMRTRPSSAAAKPRAIALHASTTASERRREVPAGVDDKTKRVRPRLAARQA